ncbi:MAG: hypothetical protein ACKOHG_00175 [Planctomycetia bacterium]
MPASPSCSPHRRPWLVWAAVLLIVFGCSAGLAAEAPASAAAEAPKGFRHRGFYLHEGWLFKRPFAVRAWTREDFAAMYQLLERLGFDRVMNWPMFESIPAPLSETDARALRDYRRTIDDAHAAGLEFWLAQCANLTPPPSIAAKPWKERNPSPVWKHVRLDDVAEAAAYFAHRRAMMEIVNTADAYVTIDGDPGGYADANPREWLSVCRNDRATLDAVGKAAAKQPVIPWVWCGWGTEKVWGGDPRNPPERIVPFVKASLDTLAAGMPEPWQLLPGRSIPPDRANGRVNLVLAEEAGLIPRSTLFLYEAIEYEPSIPGSNMQFADIRRMLRDEAKHAAVADGVFGNAQQPVMVLPNLYFFARASADLAYLDTPDEEVLGDLADLLGGPRDLLVPAWRCLSLPLDRLPADLPAELRKATLTGEAGQFIPGGQRQYLDILAAEVESRRGFLGAIAKPAGSADEAAAKLAAATRAIVGWWKVHGYVNDGDERTPFAWRFVRSEHVGALRAWAKANVTDRDAVIAAAARSLAASGTLGEEEAAKRLAEVVPVAR